MARNLLPLVALLASLGAPLPSASAAETAPDTGPFAGGLTPGGVPRAPTANPAAENPFVMDHGVTWARGPGEGLLGSVAQVRIPAGAYLTDLNGVRVWLKQQRLPVTGDELGAVIGARGAWMALVNRFGATTNTDPVAAAALLTGHPAELLAALNAARASASAPAAFSWQMAPQYDAATRSLRWCLEYQDAAGARSLPAAAFFTGRGVVTFHFRGPARLSSEVCFAALNGVAIRPYTPAADGATPAIAEWARMLFDARAIPAVTPGRETARTDFTPVPRHESALPLVAKNKSTVPAVSLGRTPAETEGDGAPFKPWDFSLHKDDYLTAGLILLTVLITVGLIIGTRVRRPGGGTRRRAVTRGVRQPVAPPDHPAGVPLAALGRSSEELWPKRPDSAPPAPAEAEVR